MEATATTPYSALTFACKTCDEHKVLHLLDSHADVNEVDDGKQSPLLCAVEGGHVLKKNAQQIVVKILLRRNADVNIAAEDGRTPIWCACRWGLIDIMRQLVDANADPTQRCAKWGESAIDVAIRYKRVTLLQQIKLSSPDASFRLNQFLRQYSEMELLRKSFLEMDSHSDQSAILSSSGTEFSDSVDVTRSDEDYGTASTESSSESSDSEAGSKYVFMSV